MRHNKRIDLIVFLLVNVPYSYQLVAVSSVQYHPNKLAFPGMNCIVSFPSFSLRAFRGNLINTKQHGRPPPRGGFSYAYFYINSCSPIHVE